MPCTNGDDMRHVNVLGINSIDYLKNSTGSDGICCCIILVPYTIDDVIEYGNVSRYV
jgi:hypothetical protein